MSDALVAVHPNAEAICARYAPGMVIDFGDGQTFVIGDVSPPVLVLVPITKSTADSLCGSDARIILPSSAN